MEALAVHQSISESLCTVDTNMVHKKIQVLAVLYSLKSFYTLVLCVMHAMKIQCVKVLTVLQSNSESLCTISTDVVHRKIQRVEILAVLLSTSEGLSLHLSAFYLHRKGTYLTTCK